MDILWTILKFLVAIPLGILALILVLRLEAAMFDVRNHRIAKACIGIVILIVILMMFQSFGCLMNH